MTPHLKQGDKPKIEQFKDGKWYRPVMKGFIHECCDCGLRHRIDFKVFPDDRIAPIEIRFIRL